jgi:uncharacterized protein (TIGR02001 family)
MKLTKMALASALALGATVAQADIEGNIAATSDYMWRGLTQTTHGAAVSGGLDWSNDGGMYAGIWTSNITDGHETDLYGGYAGEANGIGYDVGLIYYTYLSGDEGNFIELAVSADLGMATVGLAYTIEGEGGGGPNADATAQYVEGDLYIYISGGADIGQGLTLDATVGSYMFENDGKIDAVEVTDYKHMRLDLGKSAGDLGDFTISLDLISEDLNSDDTDDVSGSVSWSKGF